MRDSIGWIGRKTIDNEEYEESKIPISWRITRITGEVQYIEPSVIKALIPDQKDVFEIASGIGKLFKAVDVRPLYDR